MVKQVVHRRVSKKGKPFIAGSKKVLPPLPEPKGFCIVRVNQLFKAFISFLNDWSKDINLSFIPGQGIYVLSMDPANVALVSYTFRNITVKAAVKKNFNTEELSKVVRKAKNMDVLDFTLLNGKPAEGSKSGPDFIDVHNRMQNYTDRLAVSDVEVGGHELKVPDLPKANYVANWNARAFAELIDNASKTDKSGSLNLQGIEGKITYKVLRNNEIAFQGTVDVERGEFPKEVVTARYSIAYLKGLAKFLKHWDKLEGIIVRFGTDYPLIVTEVAPVDSANFKYILAPRIEQE